MERKTVDGTIRNKERSRQKLLKAVGKIIKTTGFSGLGVNHIATVAKVDKKLIYNYFGSLNGLIDEYLNSQDFWSNVKGEKLPPSFPEGGKDFVKEMLLSQYEYVHTNPEFQKILLWRLSEQRESLKKLTDRQEANGEVLLQNITDPYFGDNAEAYRATMAILIAGSYYLNLYSVVNGSSFCGIDLASENGRKKIRESLLFLVDKTYEGL
jgi:AcrR family transcriptional regulator